MCFMDRTLCRRSSGRPAPLRLRWRSQSTCAPLQAARARIADMLPARPRFNLETPPYPLTLRRDAPAPATMVRPARPRHSSPQAGPLLCSALTRARFGSSERDDQCANDIHHLDRFLIPVEIRPDVGAPLAARLTPEQRAGSRADDPWQHDRLIDGPRGSLERDDIFGEKYEANHRQHNDGQTNVTKAW